MLYHGKKSECLKMSKKDKTRVSVTMSRPFVETLDSMVEEGVYLSRGEAVLEGLRILFKQRGRDPFSEKAKSKT